MDRVLVVSACSGHGFKHSAGIGEAVAAELAGAGGTVDLSTLRPRTFRLIRRLMARGLPETMPRSVDPSRTDPMRLTIRDAF